MRQYRGLTKDDKLVYGWYFPIDERAFLITGSVTILCREGAIPVVTNDKVVEVIPETVGQFTGLKDKKRTEEYPQGQEIYKGDIVNNANGFPYEVVYAVGITENDPNYTGYIMRDPKTKANELFEWSKGNIEVIGNIHTTPELMEKK